MVRRYYLAINLLFLAIVPSWLVVAASTTGFDVGARWSMSDNAVSNSVFLLASTFVLFLIGSILLKKFSTNGKDSALLLASYNILYGTGSLLEAAGNYLDFARVFNQALENLVFVIVSWTMLFFFLFLQDIFTGSFSSKQHKSSHVAMASLVAIGAASMVFDSFYLIPSVFNYVGFGLLGVTMITLCTWLLVAASKLVKKTGERNARIGLMMIGLSGGILIAVILCIALKALINVPALDALIPVFVFSASIVTYMGYVYPSRARSQRAGEGKEGE
ncbi:MAG: hypothetical protein JW839_17925 [Candidatus Lokiarchaeota archaeon]|nr:hypothetical protein [Candidatus Lokiarchaeota archaeon]